MLAQMALELRGLVHMASVLRESDAIGAWTFRANFMYDDFQWAKIDTVITYAVLEAFYILYHLQYSIWANNGAYR